MAIPNVTVNNHNLLQGSPTAIEGYFLYIGLSPQNPNDIIPVNSQSDLNNILGNTDSLLKRQVNAAKLNAGSNWSALIATLDNNDTWQEALELVMKKDYSVEAVVICQPVTSSAELVAMHNEAINILNTYKRRLFFIACTAGLDNTSQTWANYLAGQRLITANIEAGRVMVVPLLYGDDQGKLAGRLANNTVSVADSPMRVTTGPLVGNQNKPIDKDGAPLSMAMIEQLDAARFSVPCWFADYSGIYWGDGNLLAAENSDYKVIENLRVVDKAARRIMPLLIADIGNRRLNNTASSLASAQTRYSAPLRLMSKSITINGNQFPGDIKPPKADAIVISFLTWDKVSIYISLQPYNSPKNLTANISLDLTLEEGL